jgi:hypothetical protein
MNIQSKRLRWYSFKLKRSQRYDIVYVTVARVGHGHNGLKMPQGRLHAFNQRFFDIEQYIESFSIEGSASA